VFFGALTLLRTSSLTAHESSTDREFLGARIGARAALVEDAVYTIHGSPLTT
jgi:hypothetical protein